MTGALRVSGHAGPGPAREPDRPYESPRLRMSVLMKSSRATSGFPGALSDGVACRLELCSSAQAPTRLADKWPAQSKVGHEVGHKVGHQVGIPRSGSICDV